MMTPKQFEEHWASVFTETIPIQHFFKIDYKDRWFRIHSLPESKRYADNEKDWEILLNRQNTIISDLLGNDAKVLLVAGDYNFNDPKVENITKTEPCFTKYNFVSIADIELNKIDPDDYRIADLYRPAFAEIIWQPYMHDTLLKCIANDEVSAFFVSFDEIKLVAPYDGGIDIIVKDPASRNVYMEKYKDWLSKLDSGL